MSNSSPALTRSICSLNRIRYMVISASWPVSDELHRRVLHDDDAEAEIDRAEHGGQHADVGFRARHHHRSDVSFDQQMAEPRTEECRIGEFVDNERRRRIACKLRHDIERAGCEIAARRALPFCEIGLPLAATVLRPLGRHEAREHRPLPIPRADIRDDRQYPFHPRRFPYAAFGEDVLHIDAQMCGVSYAGHSSVPGLLGGANSVSRDWFQGPERGTAAAVAALPWRELVRWDSWLAARPGLAA